jgi:tungstate transport system substrate-binding protein
MLDHRRSKRTAGISELVRAIGFVIVALAASVSATFAQERSIVVASTTSTQDSGLFGYLLPIFKAKTGIDVKVVAQGTGQALDTARRGDADVVFVHAKPEEEKFVADGFGVRRFDVMYNDFVLIGPRGDPAGVNGSRDITAALKAILAKAAPFVSRGDRSGTHQAELALWRDAGIDIARSKGAWYRDIGQGMGAALNTAAAMNAYVLSDRGTWIAFRNRGDLVLAVEGDQRLFNQYGIILVNPAKFPQVKRELGQRFIDFVLSPEGQQVIADYKIAGQQLFFPDARPQTL